MSFADVENKTKISAEFTSTDRAAILAAMKTIYDGSPTARAMFENWIFVPSHTIDIDFSLSKFAASANMGKLKIDLNYLANAMYIDNNGTAVKSTVVAALVHELVHALTGRLDTNAWNDNGTNLDYKGETVTEANKIYKELGLPAAERLHRSRPYRRHSDLGLSIYQGSRDRPFRCPSHKK